MHKQYHIGILLDGTRLTKVAQLRTLTLKTFTVLYSTVQLRQGENRNIKLLGKSLKRLRNLRHLLLTATETHTIGIHKLKVVNHYNLHALLAHQTTCLSTQLEDGESRSIVNIQGRTLQQTNVLVQSLPLVRSQLSVKHLVARNLTHIRYKTVDKLHIVHLKREESNGSVIVDSNVLGKRQSERGLTHRRTSGNDNKVRTLPSTRLLVQLLISRRHTCQTTRIGLRLLQNVNGLCYDWIHLRIVLLHVALRQLEERTLSLLHQFVYILSLVEGLSLDNACIRD